MKVNELNKPIQEEITELGQEDNFISEQAADASYIGRVGKIGKEEIKKAAETLNKYKEGKTSLEQRIIENEKWYKLRHWEVVKNKKKGGKDDPEPTSAWLFNNLANKHADMMDNYPEPNILPREQRDKQDAKRLSDIIPVILERNEFEQTYADTGMYKLKNGAGCYGVFWNSKLENGLGDIDIKQIDLLNIFWEAGVKDIQRSRNVFTVELVDNDILESQYPFLEGKLTGSIIKVEEYMHDDNIDTSEKSAVIDWYYKIYDGTRQVLHFCKFVGDEVLYASENDPTYQQRGFYDHARYPFIFDPLFSVEGSPVGFGYVDVCKDPQMYIDKLNQIILKNAFMAGKKRFFVKDNSAINEQEFADWDKDLIHVAGQINEDNIREFTINPLPAFIIQHQQMKIDELKETCGNTSYAQGSTGGGVTAASAIAALQEASGKLSRDNIKASYRAFTKICTLVLELIRQFYDEARCFRIDGADKQEEFVEFDNTNIREQETRDTFGGISYRRPVFDIKVSAQKQSPFHRVAQNELAKEMYGMGMFNPQMADQALMAMEMMQFESKEVIVEKIKQGQTMLNMVQTLGQAAMLISTQLDSITGGNTAAQIAQYMQGGAQQLPDMNIAAGQESISGEPANTSKARERTAQTTAV